jgi:hypothetical protein
MVSLPISAQWQSTNRREANLNNLRKQFESRMGEETYKKSVEFKTWLNQQSARRDILTFLGDAEL